MKKNFLNRLILILAVYLIAISVFNFFRGEDPQVTGDVLLKVDNEIGKYSTVAVNIQNNTENKLVIANECPNEPLDVWAYRGNEWKLLNSKPAIECGDVKDLVVESGANVDVSYDYWNNDLFGKEGRYRINLKTEVNGEMKDIQSNDFEIVRQGMFSFLWDSLLYKPLFNALIFFVDLTPGLDLGLAIILLTILIRTILLIPSRKAMVAQKQMQQIQPKLEEIRKKYKGNQEKIAQETMKIWSTNKVNPFGSCLPMLIQLPIMFALFYVIRAGLNPDQGVFLYSFLQGFDFANVNTNFLGILNLTKVDPFVLPVLVGLLMFGQMKLSMSKKVNKKAKNKQEKKAKKSEMEIANGMMIYFMPVMIAVVTASMPSGVGLYILVSTLYGVLQQYFVNKSPVKKEEVKVRVVQK